MKTIKAHIAALLAKGLREDGRKFDQYRPIEIQVNPIPRANGSCRLKIGQTEVLVGVKLDVGEPFPDTPDEGVLIVNSEFVPLASPEFEPGPPGPDAIELARVVDRGLRESQCIDFEKLCIKSKERVWMIFIDIYPLNDDGNLFDAAALAAIIALKNTVFPKYSEQENRVYYKEFTKRKLELKQLPVLCTFAKINGSIILDPNKREECALDARLSIATLGDGRICAMQKGGIGVFSQQEVLDLIEQAIGKGKELIKLIR